MEGLYQHTGKYFLYVTWEKSALLRNGVTVSQPRETRACPAPPPCLRTLEIKLCFEIPGSLYFIRYREKEAVGLGLHGIRMLPSMCGGLGSIPELSLPPNKQTNKN